MHYWEADIWTKTRRRWGSGTGTYLGEDSWRWNEGSEEESRRRGTPVKGWGWGQLMQSSGCQTLAASPSLGRLLLKHTSRGTPPRASNSEVCSSNKVPCDAAGTPSLWSRDHTLRCTEAVVRLWLFTLDAWMPWAGFERGRDRISVPWRVGCRSQGQKKGNQLGHYYSNPDKRS